jgi:hypothetical protein
LAFYFSWRCIIALVPEQLHLLPGHHEGHTEAHQRVLICSKQLGKFEDLGDDLAKQIHL